MLFFLPIQMNTNILSFITCSKYTSNTMEWIKMMEIISEDQFIQACCHYLLHEDSSLLKNTTHFFVENTVVGNKDVHKISSIFGSSFPFIKQILFDNNNDIIDQKNEFLYLLKFFVKQDILMIYLSMMMNSSKIFLVC